MHHFQDISGQKQGNYTGIIKKRTDKGGGDKWGEKKHGGMTKEFHTQTEIKMFGIHSWK